MVTGASESLRMKGWSGIHTTPFHPATIQHPTHHSCWPTLLRGFTQDSGEDSPRVPIQEVGTVPLSGVRATAWQTGVVPFGGVLHPNWPVPTFNERSIGIPRGRLLGWGIMFSCDSAWAFQATNNVCSSLLSHGPTIHTWWVPSRTQAVHF